ncbi:uncharacterized protein C05D11.1 [Dendroctonus ponderosae]|uniref:Peptidase M16C associated domain-containing protein n=1 Tax=Dendroctonus ponderosae TaxID=77166 RepID=U4UHR7_DENPD|nr:uncharacterized protein C05D11.1 [Dendroctonus ponderosae]XP_019759720.2 uncharacterized protein C05D11.1 [Dendroctonus ponderosae]ERL93539.1 hypothetical protein D910_10828 [Dendroctonus ponderosae]KAH1024325.1 hypothetical protein HUJ05_003823 [Dendroctonus ponderosae]
MPPADATPISNRSNFELCYSLKAFNKIPVSEYVSKETGLTVCIAQVEGPVVNGYFCLATEAFDDDGLPHTLEHLIFLGSENYPYKGVLDLLANRCLASGTNAWTDIDHTCYTMETAGSEGFCSLMPIFLEHILYPILSDEGFITEVHHITGEGEDAGVVYCEMQGRENSAGSRMHLALSRNMYPGHCGYSSETGGIMKNLRESTNNDKVRAYHKEFYRPENLKIIITGQINPDEVFRALRPLELLILSKGDRGAFERPWQSPVSPLESSKNLTLKYPSDDEDNGLYSMAWRGPSCVTDLYNVTACSLLLKYFTENSVSPLPKVFIEIDDPFASNISYSLYENAETCFYLLFEDVPVSKVNQVREQLQAELRKILDNKDIDMEKLQSIINKYKLENLSNIENNPHQSVACMIIGHMLYGNTKDDLQQRLNPLEDLLKLSKEPDTFWLGILEKYFVGNKYVSVECYPSKEEQQKMAKEEKERVEKQRQLLGEEGLKQKKIALEKAIESNDREPPVKMLTSVPIPGLESITFHNIERYRSDLPGGRIDLSQAPVFTYFDDLKTSFVYLNALLDTSSIPSHLRIYLPLFLESLLELPIERNGVMVPYEQVVAELNDDTVSSKTSLGLGNCSLFACGIYSQTASIALHLETSKYAKGINWIRELLYHVKFTAERVKVIALKMSNSVAQCKRSGRNVASYAMKNLWYLKDSNVYANGILVQSKFLTDVIQKLNEEGAPDVLNDLENLRAALTNPSNLVLYIAGSLENIADVTTPLSGLLLADQVPSTKSQLSPTPDHKLLGVVNDSPNSGCIVGLGCIESSFYYQTAKCITSFKDADLPALLLYVQYLIQAEGPMWKQIRGKGYAYGYRIIVKVSEGLIYLIFAKATNVLGAYQESKEILDKQLSKNEWDETLLESAKSSLVFNIIEEQKTIESTVELSLRSYFQGVDYSYNKKLLESLNKVSVDDLNRVGAKYIAPLFDPKQAKVALITDPTKIADTAEGFKKFNIDLAVYPSLEESYLNPLL